MKSFWIGPHLAHRLNAINFSFEMIRTRIDNQLVLATFSFHRLAKRFTPNFGSRLQVSFFSRYLISLH